ncbi:MBL fold metallo-hydrolase [Deinococcus sp. SL84]|uniref:MBL fold metallo-hydrolase n=1 Tax=Deinococcus sp. SL84 TaxID=2994663 RepID=UPI0022743033|nr:MBL fold metallo-hydrolase [Deinococcus sp. SL84]MCY1702881.1 MBL fold metallo-hydrolase [Deinococcus sp. SL84]
MLELPSPNSPAPPPYNQLDPVQHGAAWVRCLSTGRLNENGLLVTDSPSGGAGLLVDPGSDAGQLLRMVDTSGAEVQAILLTHGHYDHIGAVQALRHELDAPVYLHAAELPVYAGAGALAQQFGESSFQQPDPPDALIRQGQTFRAGGVTLTARELPGHSPGHTVFVGDGFVLAGDTLFRGAIAPTNLPGADRTLLLRGIVRELLHLPPHTVVYPGHGAPTTVGAERGRALFRRWLAEALPHPAASTLSP